MKKFLLFLIFIIVILASCDKGRNVVRLADQSTIMYTKIDTVYDHEEVLTALGQNEDMFVFFDKFNIKQYKSISNTNYTVLKTSNGLHLVLFDCNGKHSTINDIKFSTSENEKNLNVLKIGMTLNDVKVADPEGNYDFLLHSWQEYPQISYHFFENGDAYCIQYLNHKISEIIFFTL